MKYKNIVLSLCAAIIVTATALALTACGGNPLKQASQITLNAAELTTAANDIEDSLAEGVAIYQANKQHLNEAQKVQMKTNHSNIKDFVDGIVTVRERESAGKVAISLLELNGLLFTAEKSYLSTRDIAKSHWSDLPIHTKQRMLAIDKQAISLLNSIKRSISTTTEGVDPKLLNHLSDALVLMRSVAEIAKSLKAKA